MEKITQAYLKSLEPKAKEYRINCYGGLYLKITPKGNKSYYFIKRLDKKIQSIKIADFESISLKQAELKAKELSIKFAKIPKENRENQSTFKAVFSEWIEKQAKIKSDKHIKRMLHYNKAYFKSFELLKMRDIQTRHIFAALEPYIYNNQFESLKKSLACLRSVFELAVMKNHCEHNIIKEFKISSIMSKPKTKHRASINNLSDILELKEKVLHSKSQLALKVMFMLQLYTATRPSEARLARNSEFDLSKGVWVIPSSRMKCKNEHSITLPRQIIEPLKLFVKDSTDNYTFLSITQRPYSDNAVNTLLYKQLGYSKETITAHGLRGSFSTILNEMRAEQKHNFSHEIIELCLSHSVGSSVALSYNHAEYKRAKADLWQFWGDLLGDIELNPCEISLYF